MKNKWLLCILLMLFLPFGLFAQVAPPLEKKPCLLQGREDQGDQHQLGQDARHGGEQGTGQKRAEREAAAGQACQHEAHSTPHQTPRHHGLLDKMILFLFSGMGNAKYFKFFFV